LGLRHFGRRFVVACRCGRRMLTVQETVKQKAEKTAKQKNGK
jgi:4-hydroxy-3-methylbut-2-en-1-yl diphosphate synthase IspG/GcpE